MFEGLLPAHGDVYHVFGRVRQSGHAALQKASRLSHEATAARVECLSLFREIQTVNRSPRKMLLSETTRHDEDHGLHKCGEDVKDKDHHSVTDRSSE